MYFKFGKKAIGPVVAIALLLVVVVIATIEFQSWFQTYSSSTFTNAEQQNSINNLKIEGIIDDNLYIYSKSNQSINHLSIYNAKSKPVCSLEDANLGLIDGRTKLLLKFDHESISENKVIDSSTYSNVLINYDFNVSNSDGNSTAILNDSILSNQSLKFDGVDDYLKAVNPSTNSNKISISIWVYSTNGSDHRIIVTGNNNILWHMGSRFYWVVGTISNTYTGGANYPINNWYHIVAIRDENISKLYIDGEFIGENMNNGAGGMGMGTKDEYCIGAGCYYNTNKFFEGLIDEVLIYDGILNENQIKKLYKKQKAFFIEELNSGMNIFNTSKCNLKKGEKYNIVLFSQNHKLEQTIIVK